VEAPSAIPVQGLCLPAWCWVGTVIRRWLCCLSQICTWSMTNTISEEIRRPLQGIERVRVQEQGLQLPSIQPAASKPSQPASQTARQPASQPDSQTASQPSQPSQPASQPAQPASQRGGKVSTRAAARHLGCSQVLKQYDTRSLKNIQNLKKSMKSQPGSQPGSQPAQPASSASQPASQPSQPAQPASQSASPASQPARKKGFYRGSSSPLT
jgi:hypothetical protein